jgi:hypothetical protein
MVSTRHLENKRWIGSPGHPALPAMVVVLGEKIRLEDETTVASHSPRRIP